MNNFTITELQNYSGVKAHTIRIWEQRYGALKPYRTKGNVRYYDHLQLRRLLNIVSLLELKFKVSDVCMLTDKELNKLISEHLDDSKSEHGLFESLSSQLIYSALTYDETMFEKIFSNCILRFGIKQTYMQILHPMLVRIGLMWTVDSLPPTQEHFITNLVRQKISSAIDSLPPPVTSSQGWTLFLPENEFHELGLLFANYLIRQSGQKVIYLGANVPFDSLTSIVNHSPTNNLFLFLVNRGKGNNMQAYISSIENVFRKQNIFLSGNSKLIESLNFRKTTEWLKSVNDLELILSKAK